MGNRTMTLFAFTERKRCSTRRRMFDVPARAVDLVGKPA